MPALDAALATPGLPFLIAAAIAAGVVFGFAGFGAALIFMPAATIWLTPAEAVAAMSLAALTSLAVVVPRVWPIADRPAALSMWVAAVAATPAGLWLLANVEVTVMRWAVLSVAGLTLVALLLGWRRPAQATLPVRTAVGAATGLVGGATGLNGPIFVLFQLSGTDGANRDRANIALFLSLHSVAVIPMLVAFGLLDATKMVLGVILALPYALGMAAGQSLFRPERDRLYRRVAYAVIAGAILLALPVGA